MNQSISPRELYGEFLGTCIILIFGNGVVAQNVLSRGANGSYLAINLAWGLGVTMAVYVSAGASGAHLNPAVTLALAARRDFAWRKVGPYFLAQLLGAFVGAATVFFVYREAFHDFDKGVRTVSGDLGTAGIFSTYPQAYLSLFGGLVDQILGTAMLLLVIRALGDNRNTAPTSNIGPLLVGLLVVVIGMSFGMNAGYAINPARDLGPRLFTFVAGWGTEVFTAGNYWFWVPIIGPLIGGVLGATIYDLLIGQRLAVKQ
jgi:MIP family channel proteins